MGYVEFTRVLPKDKEVKCSVNPANIVYFQEPPEANAKVGCTLIPVSGIEIEVVESYQIVKSKLKES
jgi:hypothetical protein